MDIISFENCVQQVNTIRLMCLCGCDLVQKQVRLENTEGIILTSGLFMRQDIFFLIPIKHIMIEIFKT